MLKIVTSLICVLIILGLYKNRQLISSTSMWIFCYLLIFIVFPLYSSKVYFNENLIDLLSLIGIIVFYLGNLFGKKFVFKLSGRKKDNLSSKTFLFPKFKTSLYAFITIFLISMVILISTIGIDGIVSILNGTLTSKEIVLGSTNSNPMTYSLYLLVPCVLCMWISSKNKSQKICSAICLLIYIIESSLFEYTRIFLMTILVMIFFYEVRHMKPKKQAILVFVGFVSAISLMVFMNYTRNSGISSTNKFSNFVNIDYVFESTDFGGSYEWFDKLLNHNNIVINPIAYLKPFYAFIPRSIWVNKPEPTSMQILQIINPSLVASGYSTAGNSVLGEGYAFLGYFGMFLRCFIWGFICEKLDLRYKKRINEGNDSCLLNIYYYIFAVFIVISGQRGDWSQYMTIVLWFYFLPMYLLSVVDIKVTMKGLKNE